MINLVYGRKIEKMLQIAEFAGRTCWKSHDKAKSSPRVFIENLVKMNHQSVLEHSQLIFSVTKKDISAATILRAIMNTEQCKDNKEADTHIELVETDTYWYLGCNIRGIKNLILTTDANNMLRKVVISELIPQLPDCYFVDFIEQGIINKYHKELEVITPIKYNHRDVYTFITDLGELDRDISEILESNPELNYDGLSKLIPFTLRICSPLWCNEQTLRHRGPVSKQSLRYTRADNCKYHIPESIKGKNILLSTQLLDKHSSGEILTVSYENLVGVLFRAYEQFVDAGAKKEDARGIMPTNTETDMVVTKTLAQWGHVFSLRLEKHTQLYTRQIFSDVYLSIIRNNYKNISAMLPDLNDIIVVEDLKPVNIQRGLL